MTRGLGGYCWAEHESGAAHCTLSKGHASEEHEDFYAAPQFRTWTEAECAPDDH